MSESLKVTLQDEDGNTYYMKTDAGSVYCSDGTSVESKLNMLNQKSINQITVNEEPTGDTKLSIKIGSEVVELAEMSDIKNVQEQVITTQDKIKEIQYQTKNQDITDLNNITEPGIYITNSAWSSVSNTPKEITREIYGYLRVTSYGINGNGLCQELYDIYTGIPVIYIRRRWSGSWSSWYKFSGTAVG